MTAFLPLAALIVSAAFSGCAASNTAYIEQANAQTGDRPPPRATPGDYLTRQAESEIVVQEVAPRQPGDVFENPKILAAPSPRYPRQARAEGRMGVVHVAVYLSAEGMISEVKVARTSDSTFDQAALDAVRKWRFAPGKKNGKPVTAIITVPVIFSF